MRYPYDQSAFAIVAPSSAMNEDHACAQWRACYDGKMTRLNTVERGSQYKMGDFWGCLGVWFSGRWHTQAANDYVNRVKASLN